MNTPQLAQTGLIDLILSASLIAKLVLATLLFASVYCWAIIFTKSRTLKLALKENNEFLKMFWQGKSIEEIFSASDPFSRSPVAAVFKSGVKELKKLTSADVRPSAEIGVDNIYRALQRASYTEVTSLEKHVGWLATTASAAPFVGLFGTVWGIMTSFQGIGASGSANLAVVAPGIAEALITTATGIGAAIPAVVAYNHFANQIKRISVDIDCFSQDFLNIVQRSLSSGK